MTVIVANGVKLNVQQLGDTGDYVVFLHGLVMDNLSSWYFTFANSVAQYARVILYDLRGHGLSERPPQGYRIEDMTLDLKDLLDQLAPGCRVHLVGNSYGGLLSLYFAYKYPERVTSLCLIDALANTDGWSQQMNKTLSLTGDELYQNIVKSFKSWLGRNSEKKRSRLSKTAHAIVYDTSLREDLQNSVTMTSKDISNISCPAHLIYGENSEMRAKGEELAALMPHATLEIMAGCTHSIIWEATDQLKNSLHAWLKKYVSC